MSGRFELKPRRWTAEEIEFLRGHVATLGFREIALHLKRTRKSVSTFAKTHGIYRGRIKPWTDEEVQTLRDHAGDGAPRLAQLLGRPICVIYAMRERLGLTKPLVPKGERFDAFLIEKHALGWSDEEIAAAYAAMFTGRRGVGRHFVASRRTAAGLGSNAFSEHQRQRTEAKTKEQLAAAGLSSMAELRIKAYADRKRAMGWPDDLQMQEANILSVLWDHGPMTRLEIARAIGRRTEYPGPYGDKRILGCNREGGSLLATLLRRGMILRFPKQATYSNRGPRRKVDVYMLSPDIKREKVG
jgi:hypothetical protein